ncbi:hypothetical protein [Candidatus Symbiobacter mobilis]|uniref:Uncharacterized protein n=1 Tax=Candidatus Symbiobacter mobilis CR TaxID=946483 RepID=U5N740_9BURK|nr:hypothetical protein [Candidatus Symbiobacter mobilis]AGX87207.1 hypothetical protein Cenrod_1114 [Candidatus Symbiobacter mobilis CR]
MPGLEAGGCALLTSRFLVLEFGWRKSTLLRCLNVQGAGPHEQFEAGVAELFRAIDGSKARCRSWKLVVGEDWARPVVLPLAAGSLSEEEVETALREYARRTYGDQDQEWHWCWGPQADSLVAVSWPHAGWLALARGMAQRGCTLSSAKPMGADLAGGLIVIKDEMWLVIAAATLSVMRWSSGVLLDWFVLPDPAEGGRVEALCLRLEQEAARRGDTCRDIVLVDFETVGGGESSRIWEGMRHAGWSVHHCAQREIRGSLAWRLRQVALSSWPA